MFVRASTLVLAVAASAIAVPADTSSQCDTGDIQCCDQNLTASQTPSNILDLIGSGPIQGLIGIDCNPLGVVQAASGAECQQQPVCCSNFENNGVEVIGMNCSPVDLNW